MPPRRLQHLFERGQRLLGLAHALQHIAVVVQRIEAGEHVLGVEQPEAVRVELGGGVVGVALPRLAGGGDIALGGARLVAALAVQRRLVLELLAGLLALVGGEARLEPLGGDAIVAARALGRHQLEHQIVLEVVLEDVLGLARHRRVGHLEQVVALDQLFERRLDPRALLDGEAVVALVLVLAFEAVQDDQRAQPEDRAERGRLLEQPALERRQRGDAGLDRLLHRHGQRRLERALRVDAPLAARAFGRRLHRSVGVKHTHQLFDEERIAARQLAGVLDEIARQRLRLGQKAAQEPLRFVAGQRRQLQARVVGRSRAPPRAAHEQLGPRGSDEQDRRAAQPLGQLGEQRQRIVVAEVQIVERQHQRRALGIQLEEAAQHRARDVIFLARIFRQRDGADEGVVAGVGIAQIEVAAQEVRHLGHAAIGEDADELRAHLLVAARLVVALLDAEAIAQDPRHERIAAGAGDRTAAIDPRTAGGARRLPPEQPRQPLGDQAGLAGALRADDGHQLRRLVLDGAREDGVELRELGLASHQGHRHAMRCRNRELRFGRELHRAGHISNL